jgi:hypothetical protein
MGLSDDDSLPRLLIATHNPSFTDLARARTAKIDGPEGISQCFKLQTYSGEPLGPCNLARNLFSKERCRVALPDEFKEDGGKVALVIGAELFPCGAERLARE